MIRVRLFAAPREAVGASAIDLPLPGPTTAAEVLRAAEKAHPELRRWSSHFVIAVNRRVAGRGEIVRPGDEVALLPPVSGGSVAFVSAGDPFSMEQTVEEASRDPAFRGAGAMVAFSGLARPDDGTEELFLEAYEPMALAGMNDIERAAREKWALRSVAIRHRLGAVHVGEPVVFVVTAAEHRRQAFESAQWIMDELKRSVPIWKKEIVERRSNRGRWVHPGAPGP